MSGATRAARAFSRAGDAATPVSAVIVIVSSPRFSDHDRRDDHDDACALSPVKTKPRRHTKPNANTAPLVGIFATPTARPNRDTEQIYQQLRQHQAGEPDAKEADGLGARRDGAAVGEYEAGR